MLQEDSSAYAVLSRWIAAVCPGPDANDPLVTHIDVAPTEPVLRTGARAELKVVAHWPSTLGP